MRDNSRKLTVNVLYWEYLPIFKVFQIKTSGIYSKYRFAKTNESERTNTNIKEVENNEK